MPETSLPVAHLFTMTVEASDGETSKIRGGPAGDRMVVEVTGGAVEGERIRGRIVPPSGDWLYRYPDGSMHLDVRVSIRTDDGADILMQYEGKIAPNKGPRSAPTFLVGDERYTWLNSIQAVGVGSFVDGRLSYDVYELL